MAVIVIKTPHIPPKVAFKDLHDKENGRLFSEDEVKLLEQATANLGIGRHSKAKLGEAIWELTQQPEYSGPPWSKDQKPSYGILKEADGSLHAVYLGEKYSKHLGKGGFGKVKLQQNIKDGKWRALKVIKLSQKTLAMQSFLHDSAVTEQNLLKELKVSEGDLTKRKSATDGVEKVHFSMELAEGVKLSEFLHSTPPRSAVRWLDIALQSVQKINALHTGDPAYLHCDIKPENMLYDLLNNEVKAVDLGFAKKIFFKGRSISDRPMGTPGYMAPEILSKGSYSTQSDVFALGVTLQELFGFKEMYVNTDDSSIPFQVESPFRKDKELERFIKSMTDPSPKRRPSLEAVMAKLQTLREEVLVVSPETTGVLNIREYANASDHEQRALRAALKSVDSVVLVDTEPHSGGVRYYNEGIRHLAEFGINVRKEVLIPDNRSELAEKIGELDKGRNVISQICYFNAKEQKIDFDLNGTQSTPITISKKEKAYRAEIRGSAIITDKHLETVVNELTRLHSKNKGSRDSSTQVRVIALGQAIKKFNEYKSNGKQGLTYTQLFAELKTLETKMLATKKPSMFAFFTPSSTASVQKLQKAVNEEVYKAPTLRRK